MRVEELPAVTDVGFSETVGPEGETLALKLTVPAEPLVTAVLMVDVPLLPCVMDRLVGLELIEKSLVVEPPQEGNLKDAMRVFQLKAPLDGMYSLVYQKVQSSLGSTCIAL